MPERVTRIKRKGYIVETFKTENGGHVWVVRHSKSEEALASGFRKLESTATQNGLLWVKRQVEWHKWLMDMTDCVVHTYGISPTELADFSYYNMFTDGLTPEQAAKEILARSGILKEEL